MPGHWKFECPSLKVTNRNNKISIFLPQLHRKIRTNSTINVNTNLSQIKVRLSKTVDVLGIDDKWLSPIGRLGKALDESKEITEDLYVSKVVITAKGNSYKYYFEK